MSRSRLTKKRQATIPKDICTFLNIDAGDVVAFAIKGKKVIIEKSSPVDIEYLQGVQDSLSTEWHSKADSEAFDGL